jgi:hypothetical protein
VAPMNLPLNDMQIDESQSIWRHHSDPPDKTMIDHRCTEKDPVVFSFLGLVMINQRKLVGELCQLLRGVKET